MNWPWVALIGIALAFLLGAHIVSALERRWRMMSEQWAKVEQDRIAGMIGQGAQVTETLRALGFRPPQEGAS